MKLPSDNEIEALHKELAKDQKTFAEIFSHCQIVAEIASELITKKNLKVDKKLVRVGALLHDIGAYTFADLEDAFKSGEYITHGVRGYALLKQLGFDEAICLFARNHTGAGITKKNVLELELPMPVDDYIAETIEEKLVMYADKFHSKAGTPVFNSAELTIKKLARFGADRPKVFQEMQQQFGTPNLQELSEKYNQPIRDIDT